MRLGGKSLFPLSHLMPAYSAARRGLRKLCKAPSRQATWSGRQAKLGMFAERLLVGPQSLLQHQLSCKLPGSALKYAGISQNSQDQCSAGLEAAGRLWRSC